MDETGSNFDETPHGQLFISRVYVVKNSIFRAFIPQKSKNSKKADSEFVFLLKMTYYCQTESYSKSARQARSNDL